MFATKYVAKIFLLASALNLLYAHTVCLYYVPNYANKILHVILFAKKIHTCA